MTSVLEEFDQLRLEETSRSNDGSSEKDDKTEKLESIWQQILHTKQFDKFDLFMVERQLSSLIDENNEYITEFYSLQQISKQTKPKVCHYNVITY